jgi:hypothetical protein
MPHLIITYGPAGSGKGFIRQHYIPLLQKMHPGMGEINSENTFVAEIDSFVEADPDYKKQVFALLCTFFDKCEKANTSLATEQSLGAYIDELLTDFKEGGDHCDAWHLSMGLTKIYKTTRVRYDGFLNNDIKTAIASQKNIIFETTGQNGNPLDWLWHCGERSGPFCEEAKGYLSTIVYPYVKPEIIIRRAKKRFCSRILGWYKCLKTCKAALSDKSFTSFNKCLTMGKDVPRLPDLQELKTLIPNAQKHLIPYITNNRVTNIIVFDNDGATESPVCFNLKKPTEKDKQRMGRVLYKHNDHMQKELVDAIESNIT